VREVGVIEWVYGVVAERVDAKRAIRGDMDLW